MSSPLSTLGRLALTVTSASMALRQPARADLVAVFGDLTGGPFLRQLRTRISSTPEGQQMLSTLTPTRFPADGSRSLEQFRELPDGTLGREYARFMDTRGFEPESRDQVRFIDDPTDAWVMQRYRDIHDLWHVLTGMPTTFEGELAQKCFEAVHTGLPVAVIGAIMGQLRLGRDARIRVVKHILPWAVASKGSTELLAIRYEDRLDHTLQDLRNELGIKVLDVGIKGMKKKTNTKVG